MNETMGQIIKRLRKERNLTQEELAEQLNISAPAVSKWETDLSMPDISQVVPLCRVFGISTDVLFGVYGADTTADEERIIDEYEKLGEPTERYEFLTKVLEQYPNNVRFLSYALQDGSVIIDCKLVDDIPKIVAECERMGRILINCSGEPDSIAVAHEFLAQIYNSLGQYEHAKEHTEKLPDTIMLRSEELRNYNLVIGNRKEVMSWDSSMFYRLLNNEITRITLLARDYATEGQYENSAVCNRTLLDMIRGLFGELPPYLYLVDNIAGLAQSYVKLNRFDEALETLSLLPELAEQQKRIAIGEEISDHPLLKPAECRYVGAYDKDAVRTDSLEFLGRGVFDPIRETKEFAAIVKKLEELKD